MIASGYGVSLVPKMAATDVPNKIVHRSLSGERPRREIALCWNSKRYQSELLSNFLKALIEFAGNQFSPVDTTLANSLVKGKSRLARPEIDSR